MAEKPRVVFLYRAAHSSSGSKLMRCDQLCDIANAHLGDRYTFELAVLPKQNQNRRISRTLANMNDAIVILLKRAHATFGDGHADILRNAARAVLIDHVDATFDARALDVADVHIAASIDGLNGMKRVASKIAPGRSVEFALLPHHADPRVVWMDRSADAEIRIGYFGLMDHAVIPESLSDILVVPQYGVGDALAGIFQAMKDVNVHHAVRPDKAFRNSWKPFTKGINAAASGANVLVQRGVDDAVSLLGDEYPYLIDDASEAAIAEGVQRLERSVGSPEWQRGLEVMAALRERTSAPRIASDLDEILSRFA